MNQSLIKLVFFVILLFTCGCESYKIPMQTSNHPASSDSSVSQIELSPILDIDKSNAIKNEEKHDYFCQ